jgi:hypothetical protein
MNKISLNNFKEKYLSEEREIIKIEKINKNSFNYPSKIISEINNCINLINIANSETIQDNIILQKIIYYICLLHKKKPLENKSSTINEIIPLLKQKNLYENFKKLFNEINSENKPQFDFTITNESKIKNSSSTNQQKSSSTIQQILIPPTPAPAPVKNTNEPQFLIINYDEKAQHFSSVEDYKNIIKTIIQQIIIINPTVIVSCSQFSPSCLINGDHFQHHLNIAIDEETKKKKIFSYSLISKVDATTEKKSSKMYCARKLFDKKFVEPNNVRTRIYGNNNELFVHLANKGFVKSVSGKFPQDSLYNSRASPGFSSKSSSQKYYIKELSYRRINGSDNGIGVITHNIVLSSFDNKDRYQNIFSNYNLTHKNLTTSTTNILKSMLSDRTIKANKSLEYDSLNKERNNNLTKPDAKKNMLNKFLNENELNIFMISPTGVKKCLGKECKNVFSIGEIDEFNKINVSVKIDINKVTTVITPIEIKPIKNNKATTVITPIEIKNLKLFTTK